MEWQGWFTLAVLIVVVIAMAREIAGPDVLLLGALFTLAAAGVLPTSPSRSLRSSLRAS